MPRTPATTMTYDDDKQLWVARVDFGIIDGKRKRVTRKAKTKAQLAAKVRELENTKDDGRRPLNQTYTTAAWLTHWVDNVLPNKDLAPRTVESYREKVAHYLIPALGKIPLARLDTSDVEAMMAAMRRKGLAPRTVAYARAVLRMALAHAQLHGRVTRNVAALVPAPRKAATKLDDALDSDEAARVLQEASGDRLEALAVLVIGTGLRQGEALALRWADVDLDAGTVRVVKAKTAAGIRTISLPGFVIASLRDHRARQRTERMAAPTWADPGLVFASTSGTKLNRSNVLHWWWDLTTRAGVGRRRFHASRHTAATLMLNNGVPLEVVSATLGHAGLAITADVYAKVRPELQRTAATAMENLFGAGSVR
jgi:integrase